jgi:hypothetical protein
MESFKKFIEGWNPFASSSPKRKTSDEEEANARQAEFVEFEKAIKNYAYNAQVKREDFILAITRTYRNPLYIFAHYKLPTVDYMDIPNDTQLKAKYDKEVAELIQHGTEIFDSIRSQGGIVGLDDEDSPYDYEHQKKLSVRRANAATKKKQMPSTLRGPWLYK